MFCKAITSRGAPCIASCKAGSSYCHSHDGRFDECPVCLEEVPHIHTLRCGHPLCVECFQRMTTNACPLCRRRVCNRNEMWIRLRELSELLYDVNDMRSRASRDKNVVWEDYRYTSNEYMCTLTRIVDISCSFHSVVFRQPDFLAHISAGCGGIPSGKDDILCCARRFHSCVDSFKHRTGFRPEYRGWKELPALLYPLVPSCARYVSYLDRRWAEYREWQEWESRQSVHPLARNHLGYEWVPDP